MSGPAAMSLFTRASETHRLTAASFELTARPGRAPRLAAGVLAAGVLALLALVLLPPSAARSLPGTRAAALERDNARLRDALAGARMDLQVERATRAELDRQVSELNEQVAHLTSQLEFFNAQSGRGSKPR